MSTSNNRQYPRFDVKASADMKDDDKYIFHEIVNLSLGGMCIRVPEPAVNGAKVELLLNLPNCEKAMPLIGEVVWSSPAPHPEMGVRFMELGKDEYELLHDYLYKE